MMKKVGTAEEKGDKNISQIFFFLKKNTYTAKKDK